MKNNAKSYYSKLSIIGVLLIIVIVFFAFDFDKYLSLSFFKSYQGEFAVLYCEHPISVILSFAAIYVLASALSLPGAAILTVAGGALFGLFAGTLVVSFASTIGATIAFAISRFMLRDWVQRRFGDRLNAINEGIGREGAFYLFSLRLVPIFPFWLINLLSGLTPIPIRTFYWVSQLGMLPASIVFVNAGNELAKVESIAGILSPSLIISFAALGLLPLIIKKSLKLIQRIRGTGGGGYKEDHY